MWVYGDRTRRVTAPALLAEAEADLAAGDTLSALITLGQLLQAVADHELEARGYDARSSAVEAITAALLDVARISSEGPGSLVLRQAQDEGAPELRVDSPLGRSRLHAELVEARARIAELAASRVLPTDSLKARVPEGYAFYALHPALYAAAVRTLPKGDWRVIGIRSIGTSLAPVVAAALNAPAPVTVRPTGHPFARELHLSPELETEWAAHPGAFVVVDEGPGLSGSSFGAVADALEGLGVARERIVFLPGHAGDLGPQASPEHRARWSAALRPTSNFEEVLLPRLQAGVAALVGPAVQPLRDLSGGAWRELRPWPEPPPIHAGLERRKFLHTTADGRWLVKLAGLGRIGGAKLDRARGLHAAGFTPEPAGLVEGFIVERWVDAAGPNPVRFHRVADYLDFRAQAFPAEPESGADLSTLAEVIRVNAEEALGPAAAEAVRPWAERAPGLEPRMRRVHIDGRLHRWEWLATPDGRLLKADALDHSEGHDLIGVQDITWDIAGAELELDLLARDTEMLRARLNSDPDLLAFMRLAYPAFQLGLWTLAAQSQAGWADEGARAQAQADRYARRLATLLGVDPPPLRGYPAPRVRFPGRGSKGNSGETPGLPPQL